MKFQVSVLLVSMLLVACARVQPNSEGKIVGRGNGSPNPAERVLETDPTAQLGLKPYDCSYEDDKYWLRMRVKDQLVIRSGLRSEVMPKELRKPPSQRKEVDKSAKAAML